MEFSVIIPVYNKEKTISRCLDSLLAQADPAIELLLVDDGSTDQSPEICDKYASQYANVRCLHQENRGVSAARNAALDMARGTYLLFVDGDDYVAPGYFSVIRNALAGSACDLLLFSFTSVPETLGASAGYRTEAVTERDTAVMFSKMLRDQNLGSLWSKCFRSSIVEHHGIRFQTSLKIAEDLTFVFSYMLHALGILKIDNKLYFYKVDDAETLSKKKRTYLAEHLLAANNEMRSQLSISPQYSSHDLLVIEKALTWNYYRSAYSSIKEFEKFDFSKEEKKTRGKEICKRFSDPLWKPQDLRSAVLAFPVRHQMAGFISFTMRAMIE